MESPFRGHFRVTRAPTTLGGVELPEGARLMLMWGAGNRDPQAFECPADLDLARDRPKQHLAFGIGPHFCIGAPLARLEAKIAVEELLARASSVQLAADEKPRHHPSLFVRRFETLRLQLTQ